jgi:hypothetical protein
MSKNYSNEFIFNFLQDKNYQTERGEQEHIMYFDMDMPRILNDFVNHVKEDMLKETEQRVLEDFLMQCFEADNGNHIISTCELEQLREKYKGVE